MTPGLVIAGLTDEKVFFPCCEEFLEFSLSITIFALPSVLYVVSAHSPSPARIFMDLFSFHTGGFGASEHRPPPPPGTTKISGHPFPRGPRPPPGHRGDGQSSSLARAPGQTRPPPLDVPQLHVPTSVWSLVPPLPGSRDRDPQPCHQPAPAPKSISRRTVWFRLQLFSLDKTPRVPALVQRKPI